MEELVHNRSGRNELEAVQVDDTDHGLPADPNTLQQLARWRTPWLTTELNRLQLR